MSLLPTLFPTPVTVAPPDRVNWVSPGTAAASKGVQQCRGGQAMVGSCFIRGGGSYKKKKKKGELRCPCMAGGQGGSTQQKPHKVLGMGGGFRSFSEHVFAPSMYGGSGSCSK